MTNPSTAGYLSRGIDYLGDLAAKLRDLRGFATLAHELIQNADDVPGVSAMCFDVASDGLIVTNDAPFSDCGHVDASECPWKDDPARGFRCDFHRFRFVASGDKRQQPETTGAFGIGFIAVYQLTDAPELISAGHHWLLQEDRPEHERIAQCSGCSRCRQNTAATTFFLPWAIAPGTTLRTALNVEPVTANTTAELLTELRRSLPHAMLFLKRLNSIEIRDCGVSVLNMKRSRKDDHLVLSNGDQDTVWHIVGGEFDRDADAIRSEHGARIEKKRKSRVELAIPLEAIANGLLCATLPTQHETGMGFHINADFFPTNDRKRVIFEEDFQSRWNRAAIAAAARTFASNLHPIAPRVGHRQLWAIIDSIYRIADEVVAGRHDRSFANFVERLKPHIQTVPIVFTTNLEWCSAREAVLLYDRRETEAIPLLEKLCISVVHDDLRPFHNLLRGQDIGVKLLDIHHIVIALEALSLTKRTERAAFPNFLRSLGAMQTFWREISALLTRQRKADEQRAEVAKLSKCAIALGCDGALWPCDELFRADTETQQLFASVLADFPFVADMGEDGHAIQDLCRDLTPEVAVDEIERIGTATLQESVGSGRISLSAMLSWFQQRSLKDSLRKRLAALPLFPSSGQLRPLTELALPGDFTDPIGLAGIVDLKQLENRRDFLHDLGAKRLTLESYACEHVARAFDDGQLTLVQKRAVLNLLASRLGELRDLQEVKDALLNVALIECTDGNFRVAEDTYFPSHVVDDVLGQDTPRALLPAEAGESLRELYRWLGVVEGPRIEDVIRRVDELVADAPHANSVCRIQAIFRHLGSRVAAERDRRGLAALRTKQWLPARGEYSRWYRPSEVYASFRAYLFDSQAMFLDIPDADQRGAAPLFDVLGVRQEPEVAQVVNHLIECASVGRLVNKEVYRFLNDNAGAPPIARLAIAPCLLVHDVKYVKPSQVFWSEHPFGRFRHHLGPNLRKYNDLFERLKVREKPNHESALEVLQEIEESCASRILDDDAYAATIACWLMIEQALNGGDLSVDELDCFKNRRVIPNAKHVLHPPEWVFFEDVPGLASKFGAFLENNVIIRPPGAWRAMAAAGVRSLSSAVVASLVECEDPQRDGLFEQVVTRRRAQLARILEAHSSGLAARLEQLDNLQAQSVKSLAVQHTLHAFNRTETSQPEAVPAHYHRESNELYFVSQIGKPPWNSIARELAVLLCPEVEPGRLAPGIKEVLAADTADQARQFLDELGCPGLEQPPLQLPPTADTVDDLCGEKAPTIPPAILPPPSAAPVATTAAPNGVDAKRHTAPAESVEEALGTLLGGDRLSPSRLPDELARAEAPASGGGDESGAAPGGVHKSPQPTGEGDGPSAKRPSTRRPSGGRLRTYVTHDSCNGDQEPDSEAHSVRTAVEQAGVNRVMAYERSEEREPKEMPPRHPGYDVESHGPENGAVERFIEVKGLSGDWGPFNAALTRTQFEKAGELGDRFWLYVVERAERDDFRIFRIQNPARQVNQFIYDDGWQALNEPANQCKGP